MDVLKYSIRFLDFPSGGRQCLTCFNMYSDLEICIHVTDMRFPA